MQFRSAAESDSNSASAHWGLARAHENLGQFSETLDELRKTIELDKTNLDAKAKLGNYFLVLRPPLIAETEKLRDEILAIDPMFIEGHILSASILAAQGKPETDVVNSINDAIAFNPKRVESYISLARFYMTIGKAGEAEAAIKKGLAEDPASVVGLMEYGRFLTYSSREAEAEEQFNKAIAADQTNVEAREAIAEFFVGSRQVQKAEAAYLDLVQMQDNSPESRLVLADFYFKTDRDDEGISTLDRLVADSPEYVLARYRLGQVYLDRRDLAKVDEQLKALFEINDADTEALMLRARMRLQESKGEEAIKDLEEVLKKQPSKREPLFLMAQARLSLGQIDQANAFITDLEQYHPTYLKTGVLKIQAAFTTGDAPTALKLSNELMSKAKDAKPGAGNDAQSIREIRVRALSSRGLAYLELGRLAEAKADLQENVRLSPKSSGALLNLAKVFIAERNNAGALDLYERALAADANSFDAVSGIVSVSIRLDQPAKAHARIDQLMASNVGKGDVLAALHYLKSTLFTAEKNGAGAEKELLAAIALDENYLPAYSTYASLLVEQNRTDEAVRQYKAVLEKHPAAPVYTMLGILEDSRGNTAEAEKAYRKALEIAPETAIAANNLAWLLADNQGNLDEALQLATMAVAKNQAVAGFYDTLGWVYLKKGLNSSAVEKLKKAVALEEANAKKSGIAPNPGYRVRLGMALAKSGDRASAHRKTGEPKSVLGTL